MTVQSVAEFIAYFEKVHARTARLLPLIPAAKLEHAPGPDRFSFGDLIRHLAGIERYLFVERAVGGTMSYPGHKKALAEGYEAVLSYHHRLHNESLELLGTLSDEDLQGKCKTPAGASITVGKWLRAMLEHEMHHRGKLFLCWGCLAWPPHRCSVLPRKRY